MAKKRRGIFSIFTRPKFEEDITPDSEAVEGDLEPTPDKEVVISNFTQRTTISSEEFVEASLRDDIPESLLLKITEIINNTQPELIRQSIDIEVEKREIYNQIYPHFAEYIKHISAKITTNNEAELEATKSQIGEVKKELEERLVGVKLREEGYKERYLSSERQKRGLADKVADLELRLTAAANEQEALIATHKADIENLKAKGVITVEDLNPEPDPRIEELTTQLVEVTRNYQGVQRELLELKNQIESSTTEQENETLKQELKDTKYQYDILKTESNNRELTIARLERKINDIELENCKVVDDTAESNRELQEVIKSQREELSMLNKKLESLLFKESRTLEYKKSLDAATKSLADADKDVERYKTQAELSRQNVLALTKEVENLKAEIRDSAVVIPDEVDDLLLIMKAEHEDDILAESKRERIQRKREEQDAVESEKPKHYEDPAQMKLW